MTAELPAPPPAQRSCANCGARLVGRYCHECGQSGHLHRSLLHFVEEMLHGLLHFDAKGLRTLPLLALRPGLLTRRYLDGQRTRYVSPLLLFLFCIFLMFFVVQIMAGPVQSVRAQRATALDEASRQVAADESAVSRAASALAAAQRSGAGVDDARAKLAEAGNTQRIDAAVLQTMRLALPAGPAGADGVQQWLTALSGIKVATGHPWLDTMLRRVLANPYLFLYRLREESSRLAFLLVPLSLPFLCLLFAGRRDIVPYDHVVFSLYSLSFMSLLVIVVTLLGRIGLGQLAIVALLVVPPVHMFVQLRGTYALSAGAALWRAAALLGVAGTTFLVFLSLIVVVALR